MVLEFGFAILGKWKNQRVKMGRLGSKGSRLVLEFGFAILGEWKNQRVKMGRLG